jgi:hypothetical protein
MRTLRPSILVPVALALGACGDIPRPITFAEEPSQVVLVPVCVTFDPFAIGSAAGGMHGDSPGDVIFTENGIQVSVHKFYHPPPDPPSFGEASVVAALTAPPFGSVNIAQINNINLGFDFTGLAFVPSTVTFDWRDWGGHENLKVNGSGVYIGELTAAPTPMGGVGVSHVWAAGVGVKQGTTTLTGAVSTFGVGGQEFYLDNVCANP